MSDASRIQPAYTGGRLDIGGETSPRKQQDHLTDYNRVKQEQAAQRALEQKRDLQLLQTYDPWGKPGAGAPGAQIPLTSGDITFARRTDQAPPGFVGETFGKAGAGAPLRTGSGSLRTQLQRAPDMRIPNLYRNNPHIDRDYAVAPGVQADYVQALDRQTRDHQQQQLRDRERSFDLEQQHQQYNPFGKAGAGAPLKNPDGSLQTNRTRNLLDVTSAQAYDPWGIGAGQPAHSLDASQRARSLSNPPLPTGTSLVETMGRQYVPSVRGDPSFKPYDPFGKAGAGCASVLRCLCSRFSFFFSFFLCFFFFFGLVFRFCDQRLDFRVFFLFVP
eukprot:m.506745 g.506745  ORF g.506745 m.506745 type:complete len:331 (-) comp57373_c0_seq7:985-1977(-)